MRPSDIGRFIAASDPRLSPDGSLVAAVVTRIDLPGNQYRSRIYLGPVDDDGAVVPVTTGDHDANPSWSPDGRRIAFTRRWTDDPKASTSLMVMPVEGPGEAIEIASSKDAIDKVTWSPDGTQLAYVTRVREARYDEEDPRRQPPRQIKRFFSRLDDVGWVSDRPRNIHVVAAHGATPPRNLTPGEFQFEDPAWLPNSRCLVASGAAHDTWDLDLAVDLYLLPLDGAPTTLTKHTGRYEKPAVSPDGSMVAFLGTDNPLIEPQNAKVGVIDLASGEQRWITSPESLDRTCMPFPGALPPLWDGDDRVSFGVEDRGRVHLYSAPVDGSGAPEIIVGGDRVLTGWSRQGTTTAFTATTLDRPAELFVVVDGNEARLTSVSDAFVAAVPPARAEKFTAPSTDGVEVDAWVVLPPDLDPGRHYPALLNIHGGPFSQYGDRFFDEAQLQARAGFVVIMSNPRGSSGREERWGRAIAGPKGADPGTGWGSVDVDDVMAVVDEAVRRYPFIDPDRLGVLGGSYGGYLTSWIVGHSNRFKAACSERAVNNMLSEEWTSDIATVFRTELGVSHLDDPQEYLRMSPVTYVRDIETPLLILHSEDDLRCPISQAEELFVAMRILGKEVEMYRFPAEGHELSRSGSPVHRVQRAEIIIDFFTRHLKP
jgi:dipeptidyl aminopeptidase/acylaminoacyl peptidase